MSVIVRGALAVCVALAICGIPLAVLLASMPLIRVWPAVFAVLVSAASGLALVSAAKRKTLGLANISVWVFVYVMFGIAPIAQAGNGVFPWPGTYADGSLLFGFVIVAIGVFAYVIGYGRDTCRSPSIRWQVAEHRITAFSLSCLALMAMALVALGGPFTLFLPRSEFLAETGVNGVGRYTALTSLLRMPPFAAAVMLLSLRRFKARHGEDLGVTHRLLCVATVVLTLIVNNPISTARFLAGTVVLTLLLLWWDSDTRRTNRAWAISLVVALLLVFPFADIFRYTLTPESTGGTGEGSVEMIVGKLSSKGDYGSFQTVINSAHFVRDNGHTFGYQLLGSLFFWVPRSIWPAKPFPSGLVVAWDRGYAFANLECPIWAEGMINGGIAGVVALLFALGVIVRRADDAMMLPLDRGVPTRYVLSVVFAPYVLFVVRGSLLNAVAYFTPLIVLFALASAREPTGAA